MNKGGISAVVATILIILIVVVGVGIVWKVILPIFQELEFLSYSDVELKIVRQGFTVYDSEQNFAFVQVERGGDEVNVTGVEIGFNFEGTTKTYQSKSVPTPNGKYTYKFNFTNDSEFGIPEDVAPDKVTVAPIFTINNKVRLGKILDSEDMPVGRIRLSKEEWEKANNESATSIVVTTGGSGGEEPGVPVDPVEEEPEIVMKIYYYDGDGDGYGNEFVFQEFEEGKNDSGYTLVAGDCDDGEATAYPGSVEVANNWIDENCDGVGELGGTVNKYVTISDGGVIRLNKTGMKYILTEDLRRTGYNGYSGSFITISADNVILDLQGHEIYSSDSVVSYSVKVVSASNVTVTNGVITNDNFNGALQFYSRGAYDLNLSYLTLNRGTCRAHYSMCPGLSMEYGTAHVSNVNVCGSNRNDAISCDRSSPEGSYVFENMKYADAAYWCYDIPPRLGYC